MKRRDFLASCAALAVAGCGEVKGAPLPPGELAGGNLERGHRLREKNFARPTEVRRVPVLIVGAGIGGLSAAWRLERAGFRDFAILELESSVGGNSRYGENAVSAYPLGAHYLPLPTRESRAVRELLADLGALQGDPHAARPSYDERLLCHAPQERLHISGLWQDGLWPRLGVAAAERDQYVRFQERMAEFREARDGQGRRAFALPAALSSNEPRWRELDRITMRQWLRDNGFDSPHLHWYVNYACRDDFGVGIGEASAWAGIHYFACRNGEAANAAADSVLTAPEGNGWIVKRLAQRYADRTITGALAFHIGQNRRAASADFLLEHENRVVRYEAEQLVWAAPLFVLPHVAPELPASLVAAARAGDHAPWLVANLTLAEMPSSGAGAPLAWDNVLYDSPALGYVVATHQRIAAAPGPTVLTYYHAFSAEPPKQARERLLNTPRETWARQILADLGRAHPEIGQVTQRLDVFRHGHAMIRPVPGTIWSAARQPLARGWERVHFAHADVSGMSLFEEANYRGVRAAEQVLRRLAVRVGTALG
ncbi:NAD(P)/FAD-dependent oxidoreductase [Sulfurisoma sediminicola]|uniref:Putative NAD(P)-binding protein n=1 Tax=Sulfurisoma sediminicola TaxID=1381557 RepID=A0A497XKI8_9PROT|nr:NAD(P)/FAD-dependent oxidoreductase [Sulfurisoma sediminicola]RLJ67907.1 putative NAD(P)-binding protein [Sulfurisoma sediminicola]